MRASRSKIRPGLAPAAGPRAGGRRLARVGITLSGRVGGLTHRPVARKGFPAVHDHLAHRPDRFSMVQ
jgi:hypothetical protein